MRKNTGIMILYYAEMKEIYSQNDQNIFFRVISFDVDELNHKFTMAGSGR